MMPKPEQLYVVIAALILIAVIYLPDYSKKKPRKTNNVMKYTKKKERFVSPYERSEN